MAHNINAVFTREPGGCEISEKIRDVILNPDNCGMSDMTELMLYCAARSQHTQTVIKPALSSGAVVFCDRYCDSTAAYQGYARGISIDTVNMLNAAAMGDVKIDYTVFMDVPPDKGFKRKGGAEKNDRLEMEEFDFHRRVYNGFKEIEKANPERFLSFKAEGTKYETHELIVAALKERGVL